MASSGNTLDLPGDAMHLTGHTYTVNKICLLPGGDNIATASYDKSVGIFSLSSGNRLQSLRGHDRSVRSVEAIDADTLASVDGDTKVRVWRSSDGTLLDETSTGKPLWSIALLARNRLLIGDDSGGLQVTEWSGTKLTKPRTIFEAHSKTIRRIAVHGARSATASWDKTAKVWDTRSFECVATLQGHTNLVLCVAMNDEHIVTGSLDKTLRVYSASSFAFQRAIAAHKNWVYEVQFVQGGAAVLSGSGDKTIALHSVRSGECHWRMRVGISIECLSVLPDGRVAAAGGKPYNVVVFSTPSSKTWLQVTVVQPSKIVTALAYALTNPTALDDDYLRKYIRPEHVTTPEELLAGHNLMLLAVRLGVITRQNLRTFGGWSWNLKDSLYLPARKMHTDNPAFINAIFQHAEDVGLITEAYALKIAHKIRFDIRAGANTIIQAFGTLSERVTALEDRVGALERNFDTLHHALNQVRMNQVTLQQGIHSLSQNLTELRASLQNQDHLRKYAGVAKTLLSFIPLLGSALGNAAYSGMKILLDMSSADLVSSGVDMTKANVDNMAFVDFSNFQVVNYMFSEATIAKLEAPARKPITEAVTNSDFKNLTTLRTILREQISAEGRDDPSVAFLDIGSFLWQSDTISTAGSLLCALPNDLSPSKEADLGRTAASSKEDLVKETYETPESLSTPVEEVEEPWFIRLILDLAEQQDLVLSEADCDLWANLEGEEEFIHGNSIDQLKSAGICLGIWAGGAWPSPGDNTIEFKYGPREIPVQFIPEKLSALGLSILSWFLLPGEEIKTPFLNVVRKVTFNNCFVNRLKEEENEGVGKKIVIPMGWLYVFEEQFPDAFLLQHGEHADTAVCLGNTTSRTETDTNKRAQRVGRWRWRLRTRKHPNGVRGRYDLYLNEDYRLVFEKIPSGKFEVAGGSTNATAVSFGFGVSVHRSVEQMESRKRRAASQPVRFISLSHFVCHNLQDCEKRSLVRRMEWFTQQLQEKCVFPKGEHSGFLKAFTDRLHNNPKADMFPEAKDCRIEMEHLLDQYQCKQVAGADGSQTIIYIDNERGGNDFYALEGGEKLCGNSGERFWAIDGSFRKANVPNEAVPLDRHLG